MFRICFPLLQAIVLCFVLSVSVYVKGKDERQSPGPDMAWLLKPVRVGMCHGEMLDRR